MARGVELTRMKLLVVGHSYVTAFARSKYVAMTRLEPDLQIRLVVPHDVPHVFMTYTPADDVPVPPDCVSIIPAVWNRSHMTRVLKPNRLAAVLRTFDPDHIHIEEDPHSFVGVETAFLAQLVAHRATISFFIWDNLARVPRFPLNLAKALLTRYSFARCAMVVCGNLEAQDLLHRVKAFKRRSVVLPQVGLDPAEYLRPSPAGLAESLGKRADTPLIGFLGRLVPEKGITLLLDALSRLMTLRWKVLVIGNGRLKAVLETEWRERLGDRLMLLDAVPHDAVSQYLRCLDVFVAPSYAIPIWKEQFGLTLAQAMMAGVACIGSSSGAIPEVLGPGGLLVKENDPRELAAALEQMLQSAELRKTFGDAARAFAMERYSNTAVASGYLAAFHNLRSESSALV
jgi:glycosyltransferase involved in cell wall biosynthesis